MKTWQRRALDERSAGLLVLFALAFAGCSSGSSSSRIPDGGNGVPDAPSSDISMAEASLTATPDAAGMDLAGKDISDSAERASPDLGSLDSTTPAGPAYQGDGTGFSRVSLDFLSSAYGDWFCAVLPLPNDQLMLVGTTNTSVVVSTATPPNNEFTLLRVNGNGEIDTTFGTAGKVHVGMTTHTLNGCQAAALTKDGKVVVVGYAMDAQGLGRANDFVVARFLRDGSLDPDFGDGGMATTNFHLTPDDSGQNDQALSLALLDDGRILVGGEMPLTVVYPQSSRALLARYLPNGTLDPTFGAAGMMVLDPATLGAPASHTLLQVNSLLVESDGSTFAGLTSHAQTGDYALAVLGLNSDGSPDSRFASNGVLWETRATLHQYQSLVQLSRNTDGSLVVLGRDPLSMFLYRYSADGKADPRFGVGGQVVTPYDKGGIWQANVLLRPSDGGILVGLGAIPPSSTMGRFGLVRYTADGLLDEGFGWLSWDWYNEDSLSVAYVTAGAVLANDDVILAGYITSKHSWDTNSAAMRLKKTAN